MVDINDLLAGLPAAQEIRQHPSEKLARRGRVSSSSSTTTRRAPNRWEGCPS